MRTRNFDLKLFFLFDQGIHLLLVRQGKFSEIFSPRFNIGVIFFDDLLVLGSKSRHLFLERGQSLALTKMSRAQKKIMSYLLDDFRMKSFIVNDDSRDSAQKSLSRNSSAGVSVTWSNSAVDSNSDLLRDVVDLGQHGGQFGVDLAFVLTLFDQKLDMVLSSDGWRSSSRLWCWLRSRLRLSVNVRLRLRLGNGLTVRIIEH